MICQHCRKNPATTRIKRIANGELSEIALCGDCARKLGYGGLWGDWGIPLSTLFGGMMEEQPERERELRCPVCGSTFDEIARTGQVGCAQCYQTFRQRLSPMIQHIHGSTAHRGKSPLKAQLAVGPKTGMQVVEEKPSRLAVLEEKEKQLRLAVEEQNFELAVVLRDEIKAMKEETDHE